MNGKIKKLISDRGFGFIAPEDGGKDLFFHSKELAEGLIFESLHEGDAVTFEVKESPKGPNAVQVALAAAE